MSAEVTLTRQKKAQKALRTFWVAGTAGAFLSALSQKIPIDMAAGSWPPHWPYAFDPLLRYLYMIWFLFYFAISSFSTEQDLLPKSAVKNIFFDVLQSALGLSAIYFLGFAANLKSNDPSFEYLWANAVIFSLSLLSWIFFSVPKIQIKDWRSFFSRVASVRALGILLSFLGMYLSCAFADSLRAQSNLIYLWLFILFAALAGVLVYYWRMRWNHGNDDGFEDKVFFSSS